MSSPTLHKAAGMFSAERMARLGGKVRGMAITWQTKAVKGYNWTRVLVKGPVRNGFLVSREFAGLVGRERQFKLPAAGLWGQAKSECAQLLETMMPKAMREQGKWSEALKQWTRQLQWGQVGSGALVAAEILSLYYMSKLLMVGGKKTIQAIF